MENEILEGTVRLDRSETGYPAFSYRPLGWSEDLPLMRASSMVSELAPVVRELLAGDSRSRYSCFMKTTVDIPVNELQDAIRFARAKTKREAIVTAIVDFNRRQRMSELVKHAGTCKDLLTVERLRELRARG